MKLGIRIATLEAKRILAQDSLIRRLRSRRQQGKASPPISTPREMTSPENPDDTLLQGVCQSRAAPKAARSQVLQLASPTRRRSYYTRKSIQSLYKRLLWRHPAIPRPSDPRQIAILSNIPRSSVLILLLRQYLQILFFQVTPQSTSVPWRRQFFLSSVGPLPCSSPIQRVCLCSARHICCSSIDS